MAVRGGRGGDERRRDVECRRAGENGGRGGGGCGRLVVRRGLRCCCAASCDQPEPLPACREPRRERVRAGSSRDYRPGPASGRPPAGPGGLESRAAAAAANLKAPEALHGGRLAVRPGLPGLGLCLNGQILNRPLPVAKKKMVFVYIPELALSLLNSC